MKKVETVVDWELNQSCSAALAPPFRWPSYDATAAVVPFYGGGISDDKSERKRLTGNAHSTQPRELKGKGLAANLCALLRDVAKTVLVTTCQEVGGDRTAVEAILDATLDPSLRAKVAVEDLVCGTPRNLPFEAVRALQARDPKATFYAYNEADLIWNFRSKTYADAMATFFSKFPNSMVTPHRWHKRYGSDPECGHACGTQVTGQNLCHLGVNIYAVARVPLRLPQP